MPPNIKIICFRHCCSKTIFCTNIPEKCPICHSRILDFNIEPFVIPYPYTNAANEANALVVRPSEGNFLADYNIINDLHIGLTNCNGIVFEYDKAGLVVNNFSKWANCIAIHLIPSSWDNHWNDTLKIMLKDPKWISQNYNEISMNCFDFIREFINNLQYMNTIYEDKESICEKLILPKMNDVIKYNSILEKLKFNEFFIS